jgi:type I restriction enzyme R subunit
VNTLYGAVKPDPAALEFAGSVATLDGHRRRDRAKLNPNPADITRSWATSASCWTNPSPG